MFNVLQSILVVDPQQFFQIKSNFGWDNWIKFNFSLWLVAKILIVMDNGIEYIHHVHETSYSA